jgi:predicted Fe-Mo cluster-binding NifX family protein
MQQEIKHEIHKTRAGNVPHVNLHDSPEVLARHQVINKHHAKHILAREVARRIVSVFRAADIRQVVHERKFVEGWLAKHGVSPDEYNFAYEYIVKTIDKDLERR